MWNQMLQLCKKCSLAVLVLSLLTVSTVYAGGFEAGNFNGEAVVNSARIHHADLGYPLQDPNSGFRGCDIISGLALPGKIKVTITRHIFSAS